MGKIVPLGCVCATVRRASRALTSLYDEGLRGHGMTISQFTILQALERAGPVAQGRLGEMLAIDSTTLTRSLRPMIATGWIGRTEGEDRRAWRLSLAEGGRAAYEAALPDWEAVQGALRKKVGPHDLVDCLGAAERLTRAAYRVAKR